MSFAHPRQPVSRPSYRSKPLSTLSYREPPGQNTAAFKSTGKTFDFHNPKKNAAPVELRGKMVQSIPSKHIPATWESLLSHSRTFHEEKPTKLAYEARRLEQKKAARTLYPELQDEPSKVRPRNPLRSFLDQSQKTQKGITGCERRHNPRMYKETFQVLTKKYRSSGGLNLSADSEIINRLYKERNIDRIGSPTGIQIKDSTKSAISYRPYLLFSSETTIDHIRR